MTDHDHRRLRSAVIVFATAFVIHNADHARRGIDAVTEHVIWAGTGVAMLSAVLVALVLTRHPESASIALVAGFTIAVGVSLTHLLPDWGILSDSLPSGEVDNFTWFAVLGEVFGAGLVGSTGLRILRRIGFGPQRSLRYGADAA